MTERQHMEQWFAACVDMMGLCADARHATPTAIQPHLDALDAELPDPQRTMPMHLSPKVAERLAENEAWREARKRYLVRHEEQMWEAGPMTAWHISEIPREDIELPKEGVKPMQPYFEIRWDGSSNSLYASSDFLKTAAHFHAVARGCYFVSEDVDYIERHLGLNEP